MNYVEINSDTIAYWQKFCNQSLDLLTKYKIFIDSYVLEFFSEDLWNKVPVQWRTALSQLSPQQLATILQPPGAVPINDRLLASVLPLSFLAFRAAAFSCSLPRTAVQSVQPFLQYLTRCKESNFTCPNQQTPAAQSCCAGGCADSCSCARHNAGGCADSCSCARHNVGGCADSCSCARHNAGGCADSCSCARHNAAENAVSPPPRGPAPPAVIMGLRPAWPSDHPGQALWQAPQQELRKGSGHHTLLSHVFRRHLKPKKQHEVARHALVAAMAARATRCQVTADIGGGCGHLARLMAYGYNMEVVCVDREQEFVKGARKFDAQLEQSVKKLQRRMPPGHSLHLPAGPRHAACLLRPGLLPQHFVQTVVNPRGASVMSPTDVPTSQGTAPSCGGGVCRNEHTTFGLTGLHTCGDLAPVMLRLFLNCPQCSYVVSVACCYMKLSLVPHRGDACTAGAVATSTNALLREGKVWDNTADSNSQINAQFEKSSGVLGDGGGAVEEYGYPMSQHCGGHPAHDLSYAARELACHALEAYTERLGEGADNLKVHCYRAALEHLLVRHYPQHRRAGLRPVRHAHSKAFCEYARSAVSALDGGRIQLPEEEVQSLETEEMLARWHEVIVFYSLRLLLAPVIETVILLDRCFFLYENGVDCVLVPAFDPKLSPRNMILLATKRPR
ncbi:Methyltransferase domain [Trinorchestia longiramus]|nr:Methyltransferase domain [Trinorchestia longiramus]